jgi:MoaA/NifB/PqqE/SkfB family radical SAM enzyme
MFIRKVFSKLQKIKFGDEPLKLICRDNRIKLYSCNQELTADICLHTSLLVNNNWVSSQQGIWQIDKKDNGLSVTIDWEQIPVRQIWQFKKNEGGFNWIVYLDVKEKIKIDKMLCGIILKQDYETWISSTDKGNFPSFNNSWENIFLQDPRGKLLGVENTENSPAVIIENLQHGDLLLQNSPQGLQSRALRIQVDSSNREFIPQRYKPFNTNLHVLNSARVLEDFLRKKNKQFFEARRLKEGKLELLLENSTVQLYWDGKKLTANQGLHAAIQINDEWFDSEKALWNIERINDQCIYIDIDYRPLPIKQSWQLTIKNNNSFNWKVKTDVAESNKKLITKMSLGLILDKAYRQWFGGYESGVFGEQFSGWQQLIEEKPSGVVGVKNTPELPGIVFENEQDSNNNLLVQNGNKDAQARFLQSAGMQKVEFSQTVRLLEKSDDIEQIIKDNMDQQIMEKGICTGKLKLICDKGKVRIFSSGKEITADIGLHSAVCSGGRWHDSGKMNQQLNKLSDKKLRLNVDFSPFPAVQTWDLEFDGQGDLNWDITTKLTQPVDLDEYKSGIILNQKYRKWFNSFEQGGFPEKFSYWHDIIRNRDGETFGIYPADGQPGVMFTVDKNHLSLIQNTDEKIKGRVLQGQVKQADEAKHFEPSEFKSFSGKLRFVDTDKDIEEHLKQVQPLVFENEDVYLYAENAFLHNRIAGVDDFEEKVKKIKALYQKDNNLSITIGVSRYNFYKLEQVLKFAFSLLGKKIDIRDFKLNIFPLNRLRRNFIEYLEELKKIAKHHGGVDFVLTDKDLFKIIVSISAQADSGNERQLLRLMGVMCEHAFIGPQIIVIDPYHRCNANCVHCWVHTPGVKHPKSYYDMQLDTESFRPMADDLAELMVDLIIFQGDGEPLMNRSFFEMVEYARNKGIQVSFFTNGILLDRENAQKAVDNQITEIFCSLPAGTAKTFAKINTKQTEQTFGNILENLKYLNKIKQKNPDKHPRLVMTHVIHNQNAHELVEMAQNDIDIGADVMRFYLIRLDENIEFLKLSKEDLKSIKAQLEEIKQMVKGKKIELLDTTDFQLENIKEDTGSWSADVFVKKGCTLGWNFCLIPASGEVSFCCHLRTVGYLKDKSFKQIWNSEDYQRFRYQAKFLKDNPETRFLNGTPMFDEYCQHCDTHQVIRDVWDQFKLYDLESFIDTD